MTFYLLIILAPLALLLVFMALVTYEEHTGRRLVLAGRRYMFDRNVERMSFVVRHVDWGAFMHDLTRSGLDRLLHDIAHNVLIGVRFAERELTHVVRTLRARRMHPSIAAPQEDEQKPSRLATMASYVKHMVSRSRRQLPPASERREE